MKNEERKINNWEKNSGILRERYPGLAEGIAGAESCPAELNIAILKNDAGMPTMTINGAFVHSARDPAREGRRLAEASLGLTDCGIAGSPAGPVIILGFGLGYAAEAAAELAPGRPVIIVEKYFCLLRKAFEERDLSRLLLREGIAFVPGGTGEGVIKVLSFFEKKAGGQALPDQKANPAIMRNRALTGIDGEWYGAVENRIRTWVMQDDVNKATQAKFGRRWERNMRRNMDAIRDLPGIARLAGLAGPLGKNEAAKTFPVFLAAAGPSLDRIAPLLPEIRKRCIIVAVDTSLRFLLAHGVDPDFTVVADPQFWNSRHLDCMQREQPHTRLIIELAVYPSVLRLPCGGMFLCGSIYPMGESIEAKVDPKGRLGTGGSVATTAWDFSRILGTDAIWISGLDLSFPGLKTHFKGALFEDKALAESNRLNPAETWLVKALRDGIPFSAPSISGGQVLTDRRLSLYAAWFESNFRQNPGIRNYSLSSDGLAIAGLEPSGTESLLALPDRRCEIESGWKKHFPASKPNLMSRRKKTGGGKSMKRKHYKFQFG